MTPPLTKAEARAYRQRWRRASARELEVLRSTPLDVKWQQFNTLLAWAQHFARTEASRRGEEEVWQRWARLRKAHRG
ncbi:MAG: hypothetical protein FJ303_25985 [Planctomycetes bacterium]|nr:hypothetical protein [Planctomycetota bacterium]